MLFSNQYSADIAVAIIYSSHIPEGERYAREIAVELNDSFENLCSKTKNHEPVLKGKIAAYSEQEFTMLDLRQHIEYKVDYLSHKSNQGGSGLDVSLIETTSRSGMFSSSLQ